MKIQDKLKNWNPKNEHARKHIKPWLNIYIEQIEDSENEIKELKKKIAIAKKHINKEIKRWHFEE